MHHCHATNCSENIPPEMLMCKNHWRSLPWKIKKRVWDTYRPGQCDDMKPSREYCMAAKDAVIFVAVKEGIVPNTELYDFLMR